MSMVIDNRFQIGDMVYLATDPEQLKRVVTAIIVSRGELLYELCQGTGTSRHYDFEISAEENVSIKLK